MDAMKPSESYTQFDHYLNNPIGGFRLAFQGLVDHFKKDEYETEKERRFHAVESLHKADLSPEEARSLFESAMNLYAKVPKRGGKSLHNFEPFQALSCGNRSKTGHE